MEVVKACDAKHVLHVPDDVGLGSRLVFEEPGEKTYHVCKSVEGVVVVVLSSVDIEGKRLLSARAGVAVSQSRKCTSSRVENFLS